jgi:hypothetical protein
MSDQGPDYDHERETPAADAGFAAAASEPTPAAERRRRGAGWWVARVALALAATVLVLLVAGLLLYNYGTMWPPSAEVDAQYQTLVAAGKAPPETPAPGLRIPIPGCVCHAADADLAQKAPGHAPDPTVVVAHRYRTIRECFSQGCHGGGEAAEGRVPGEPGNPAVIPAQ